MAAVVSSPTRQSRAQRHADPVTAILVPAIAIWIVLVIGCETQKSAPITASAENLASRERAHQQIRERTKRRFAQASFLSPRPDSDTDIPLWMAPLIVHEYTTHTSEAAPSWTKFGSLAHDANGQIVVEDGEPTVYLSKADITVGSRSLQQITCLWFYPTASASDRPIRYRGFRMTLGKLGYAVVWDMLSSDSQERIMFVSKPVEQAARKEFGSPLPGRQFAVEPSLSEHPEVVVPRVVGDGPQPMGPFVYLDAESQHVSTLICRCEPSQADEFPASGHYRLQQVATLEELFDGEKATANRSLPLRPETPQGLLRLPAEP